jgi:fatty aldehyde-generating acyl-ACP reductase
MDCPTACLDFAVIGHQDSWQNITAFVNCIRGLELESLPTEKIKDIFPFIPPRDLFRVKVKSKTGAEINGVYIDTFINPDKLDARFSRSNIHKVTKAALHAQKLGAKIVTLGGFTSIVLEGNLDELSTGETKFTTGNTLTSAYIVKGMEQAARCKGINLSESAVLVIGATGDIGTACVNYLKNKVRKLLLCARNNHRLEKLSQQLARENIKVEHSTSLDKLVAQADIIISVASSSNIELTQCKANALICDAGYPKNLEAKFEKTAGLNLFHGGMGQVSEGYDFIPDYSPGIYNYPAPYVIHGCILEAMILAFENKIENFSVGKGNIAVERMEEIYTLSLKHGIHLSPFYNSKGLWSKTA